MRRHGLEGFIRVAEAPPHPEPEAIAKNIDVDGISEATVHAIIELESGGLHTIEILAAKILVDYFSKFSIQSTPHARR